MLKEFLAVPGLEVTAICDVVPEMCQRAAKSIQEAGRQAPAIYDRGERDFERLVARDDVDFVYIATPWEWHHPPAIAAMTHGKHAGIEAPGVYTLDDCRSIVQTSERTRRHCILMENCCYAYWELLVLNLVRAGVLGELVHAECAYNHDLRRVLFDTKSEGLWRRHHHTLRDGNLYPPHGLGPVANYLGINRGDRFESIVSMSSSHLGLEAYRAEKLAADDPRQRETYRCGDYNTSLIKTARGRTIMLQHNVSTPRPYDRINLVHGTKGIFRDYPPRIYVDGTPGREEWQSPEPFKATHQHRFWSAIDEAARGRGGGGGHGGMDYVLAARLVECMRKGLAPDIDVYDTAAWSVAGALSVESVAKGSSPVRFPDFTSGRWKTPRSWGEDRAHS
jgi:predicted dehydrogenase